MAVATLPFDEANALISNANRELVVSCFGKRYSNFGFGYMHSTDHLWALRVLLDREPTFLEVYDSYHSGSAKVDEARKKVGGNQRPMDWDRWNGKQRRYAVLVHLNGMVRGGKIFDGVYPDPTPQKTLDLLYAWGGAMTPTDPSPPPVDPVIPPPLVESRKLKKVILIFSDDTKEEHTV